MIPEKLVKELERWIDGKKYGYIQVNFNKGKIINFNRHESISVELWGSSVGEVKVSAHQSDTTDG